MSKGVQIAIATLSVFAGIGWLIHASTPGDGVLAYYAGVPEFLETGTAEARIGEHARVHGFVVDGSIHKDLVAGHVDFHIQDADQVASLAVRYQGIDVPDLFRDGAEVVVEGRLEGSWFLAERLMAKCPSKYEAETGSEA